MVREGNRVTGVTTSAGERRAGLVIGADGRNSRIARLAGAAVYHDHPPVTFAYYTYWRGSPVAGVHAWLEPGRFFGVFPVGDGLTLAFVQAPRREYDTFRSNPVDAHSVFCAGWASPCQAGAGPEAGVRVWPPPGSGSGARS